VGVGGGCVGSWVGGVGVGVGGWEGRGVGGVRGRGQGEKSGAGLRGEWVRRGEGVGVVVGGLAGLGGRVRISFIAGLQVWLCCGGEVVVLRLGVVRGGTGR